MRKLKNKGDKEFEETERKTENSVSSGNRKVNRFGHTKTANFLTILPSTYAVFWNLHTGNRKDHPALIKKLIYFRIYVCIDILIQNDLNKINSIVFNVSRVELWNTLIMIIIITLDFAFYFYRIYVYFPFFVTNNSRRYVVQSMLIVRIIV